MVKVVVNAIHRIGDEEIHLELMAMEAEQPRVIDQPRSIDEVVTDVSKVAEYVTSVVTSALQKTGQLSRPIRPKMALFLTMEEYDSMGRPQINEVFDLVFGEILEGSERTSWVGPVISLRRGAK